MELKVEGTDLSALIEKATIEALGTAGRDALVKEVVRYLTTEPTGSGYNNARPPSPMMVALRNAADRIASKVITERLEKDEEFVKQIEAIYVDAFRRFNDTETRQKLVTRMADKLAEAFSGRGY